jgi:ABC-type antimicrobial peptide transport system permease subunit
MHFTVIAGRWFDSSNIADKQNVVLNETAVKQFGIRQPIIGRRFNHGTIIGIVKDFYYKNMHEKTGAVVMRTGKPRVGNIVIQANAGQAKAAVEVAEQVWKKYFPGDFFDYSFLEEEFDKMYKNDQQASSLAMAFSGLSILICCLGLLGITIFMTEHHKKEIAIRKVLGATITGIVIQISKDFIRLVAFAIFIAIPFGWWAMHTWLEDYAYKINIGVDVFFIAGASATLTAMATIGFLVIKSAMANPVDALRRT